MTTKRFCDICKKEATRATWYSEIDLPDSHNPGHKITIGTLASFQIHAQDRELYSADICPSCADDLILKLLSPEKRKELGI